MLRIPFRALSIHTAALAVFALPCSQLIAQEQPGNVPETKAPAPTSSAQSTASSAPLTLTLPSWQHGSYWQQHGYLLLNDFGDLEHFHDADTKLGPPAPGENRVVFMGDSITEGWHLDQSFPGKPYINRGISGQTSTQMLLRFRQDVIDLQPKVVVILAGTNDVAQNTGPISPEQTEGDIVSMAQLAQANGIRPVICSILPSTEFWWHRGMDPAPKIAAINEWLKNFAAQQHYVYVDFYDKMKDAQGGLPANLSRDGVHPGPAGHAVMNPLVEAGIEKAMKSRK
ncbi:MAG TPA: SGNH/GDSL hydrolase family protein [Terracidiphilus sp.]|nr:SGNH/GDSL hydrolase family protein [Terracidiphilus sp.]